MQLLDSGNSTFPVEDPFVTTFQLTVSFIKVRVVYPISLERAFSLCYLPWPDRTGRSLNLH